MLPNGATGDVRREMGDLAVGKDPVKVDRDSPSRMAKKEDITMKAGQVLHFDASNIIRENLGDKTVRVNSGRGEGLTPFGVARFGSSQADLPL